MVTFDFHGLSLPAFGMGTMRLPTIKGEDSKIDVRATAEMADYAIARGVNYFDTAWGYHGGNSERVMGAVLAQYPRESFFLASKFPGFNREILGKVREVFPAQLTKCGVDYFDFYLFHNVSEINIDGYLDPANGIFDYLIAQKKEGKIRHLGFSSHGALPVLKRFLEAYGSEMEFCQLQLNWLDWNFQQAREKVALLKEYGIPVWVMEPLRGGKLANLPEHVRKSLSELDPAATPAKWAFRFLQSIPEVGVTLSGVSNMDQLRENISLFESKNPLSEQEFSTLTALGEWMTSPTSLPCTGCRYCVSKCPQGLDIPALLEFYNQHMFEGGGFLAPMALSSYPKDKRPGACIACGSCERVCPQNLKIPDALAKFAKMLAEDQGPFRMRD